MKRARSDTWSPLRMENPVKRCPKRSPGGITSSGRLPRKGTQCGLPAGHDGEHTVLIPSGSPWFPKPKKRK